MDENELDKHYLVFDRPYVYTCSCGVVMYWYPDGSQKLAEKPKGKLEYLPCGHAVCALREIGGYPNNEKAKVTQCMICLNRG